MNKLLPTALLFVACQAQPVEAPGAALDGESLWASFERGLLERDALQLSFEIRSEGEVSSQLVGELDLAPGNVARLEGKGSFAGREVDLALSSNGDQMDLSFGGQRSTDVTPDHLEEALILGMTRMGLLHNLALLTGGRAPDHSSGGVGDWIEVRDLNAESAAGLHVFRFVLLVDGQESGEVTLRVDAETGLPTDREQLVHFPTGDMRVTETYSYP